MVHGYTDQELIRLNEDSIWSGGPIDRVNPRALDSLPRIREQIAAGNLTAAGETWQANFTGTPTTDMRAYQPAGEMRLDFSHGAVDAAAGTFVDMGGSIGFVCVQLAQRYRNMRFVVQDLPKTVESAPTPICADAQAAERRWEACAGARGCQLRLVERL